MNLNLVQICGRITRDPEVRTTPGGTQVANFSVASNRTWKGNDGQKKEEVEFHNVVAFGRQAEIISQYFHKGDEIYVRGRLKTSSWDDSKTGTKKYKTDIIVEEFKFGQKARNNSEGDQGESRYEDQSRGQEMSLDDINF